MVDLWEVSSVVLSADGKAGLMDTRMVALKAANLADRRAGWSECSMAARLAALMADLLDETKVVQSAVQKVDQTAARSAGLRVEPKAVHLV